MESNKNKHTISTWGFIMSVLGAAAGLGGIWGFPTKMNQYGGTFLIPFFIALIICGVPVLLVEMVIGNKYRKNHVQIFEDLANKPGRFFGFLQSTVVWLMGIFYSVLVAWSLLALIMGFLPGLTEKDYFIIVLIGQTNDNPTSFSQLGSVSVWILISLIGVWTLTGLIVAGGVTKGLDKANKIFVPGLFIIIVVMMIYTMTLNGALDGIKRMFSFQGQKLLNTNIWTDAFGQAFFLLSTCVGAIIIFSSHAPKNQDNMNKTLIIASGVTLISLVTSCTVFATIASIAKQTPGSNIEDIFKPGPTLIFQVFPQIFAIIATTPVLLVFSHIVAIFFFLSVFFAGISSLIAILEAVVNPIETEWKIKRYKVIIFVILASFLINILFIFNNSAILIDGLATWSAGIWQMIIGIFELIGVMWIWKCYKELKEHNNKTSWFKWNNLFRILCLFIIPTIIALNLGFAFYQLIINIKANIFVFLVIGTVIGAIVPLIGTSILTFIKKPTNKANNKHLLHTK